MKKLNKKGFTLTEMIVVIAIIGILAAVLIPSVIGYVNHARKSNDIQLAASMTDEIERYCIENNINQDNIIGSDVRTILSSKKYNLVPSSKNWTYVYNSNSRIVEVLKISNRGQVRNNFIPKDPSNYEENMYLVGEGKSNLEQAVKLLLNYKSLSDYQNAINLLKESSYKNTLESFNPDTTLYVNNISCLNVPSGATKIVYTVGTYNLPNIPKTVLSLDSEFTVPCVISSVNEFTVNAYSEIFTNLTMVSNNKKYATISLSNLDITINNEGKVVSNSEFKFGELVTESISQSIAVDIIGYTTYAVDKNADGKIDDLDKTNGVLTRETKLVYEVTIIYFGSDGIIAKGTKTILSEVINNDLLNGIYSNYPFVEVQ